MPFYLIKLYSGALLAVVLLQGCALDQFAKKDELPSSTPTGGYPGDPNYTPPPYGQPIVVDTPIGGFPGYDTTTYHYVQTGDTLYRISVMYGVTTNDLLRWNPGINPNDLRAGQRIAVSGGPTSPTAPIYTPPVASPPVYTPPSQPNQPSGASYHVVQAGETLFRISKMYGVTVDQLMAWNRGVDANSLSIGQRLMVVPSSTAQPAPVYTPPPAPVYTPPAPAYTPPSASSVHTVQQGDTLYNISRRYNMSVEQLANLNNFRQPYPPLSIGQQLRVSSSNLVPDNLAPKTNTNYHTVQAGENLYRIALRYGHTTEQVANWNNLSPPYNLSVGQRLVLYPASGVTMQSRTTATPTPVLPAVRAPSHHIVERNETLSTIATKYDVTVQELAIWNGIGSPYTVFPGQKLLIP